MQARSLVVLLACSIVAGFISETPTKWNDLDSNADGLLDEPEFSAFFMNTLGQELPEALFAQLDTNSDSKISRVELRAFDKKVHGNAGDTASSVFSRIDKDKDKAVPQEEFAAYFRRQGMEVPIGLFQKIDADGDGRVSGDEFKARYESVKLRKTGVGGKSISKNKESRGVGKSSTSKTSRGSSKDGESSKGSKSSRKKAKPSKVSKDKNLRNTRDKKSARESFSGVDLDGDGAATRKEFETHFSNTDWETLFATIDTNEDGYVNFREFEAHHDANEL